MIAPTKISRSFLESTYIDVTYFVGMRTTTLRIMYSAQAIHAAARSLDARAAVFIDGWDYEQDLPVWAVETYSDAGFVAAKHFVAETSDGAFAWALMRRRT